MAVVQAVLLVARQAGRGEQGEGEEQAEGQRIEEGGWRADLKPVAVVVAMAMF